MSEIIKLSTTTSLTSTYAGDAANGYIGDALLSADTIKRELITFMPNIKYREVLQRLTTTDIIQLDSATFTPSSTITVDERALDPIKLKVNLEVPTALLENTWIAKNMKSGANNSTFPTEYADYVIQYIGNKTGEGLEKMIWAGKIGGGTGTYLDNVDGLMTKALAVGSGTINVAPTTLTVSNIATEIGKVYAAIPDTVIDHADLRICISKSAMRLYKTYLAQNMGNGGSFLLGTSTPGTQDTTYLNTIVTAVPGMPTNNMLSFVKDNVFLGTDLMSDYTEIKLIDMVNTTGDRVLRYLSRFSVDVNYAWGKQIVAYGTQLT